MQAAYRKRRSTVDHLLVIQEIFHVYRYKKSLGVATDKQPLYLCLMDLAKAFDTVLRDVLFTKAVGRRHQRKNVPGNKGSLHKKQGNNKN